MMHACGHDTHITTWLATARRLAAMKDQWSGTLVMILQPGEERVMGAQAMLDDGLFTRFPKPDYLRSELSRRIHIALTPREMQCVQLRAQGLTYEEIAKVMQIRRGTVGAVLTRASKKIREVFGPLAEGLP